MSERYIYVACEDRHNDDIVLVFRARIVVTTPRTLTVTCAGDKDAQRAFGKTTFRKSNDIWYSAAAALTAYIARQQRYVDVARSTLERFERNVKAATTLLTKINAGHTVEDMT